MRSARVALACGLALTAIAIGVVMSHAPASVAHTNGVPPEHPLSVISGQATVCQGGETVPRGTTAIVAWLGAAIGPRVTAEVLSGGHIVIRGEHGSDWTGRSVTIPVKQTTRSVADAKVCFAFSLRNELVSPVGRASSPAAAATSNGKPLPGQMSIEYLRLGSRSWWSRASGIAYRMGLGRIPSGKWAVLVAIALAAAVATIASSLLVKELR